MLNTRSARPIPHCSDLPIADRLDLEWCRLRLTRQHLATVRGWRLPGEEVCSLDDILARCGYLPTPPAGVAGHPHRHAGRQGAQPNPDADLRDEATDAYLIGLLRVARTEPLAARIVLQRILPALVALSRRHGSSRHQQRAVLDDLVANAWPIIRSYPVERRPRRVVPNLVRDIGFQTVVRPRRRLQSGELPVPAEHLERADRTSQEPLEELVEVLGAARYRGAVTEADIELLGALVSRERTALVAAELGVTARTVRNHRDAAVHRLRSFVAAAA